MKPARLRLVEPAPVRASATVFDPARRGYHVAYRLGAAEVPRCPGCGRTHWHVGRQVAECAFCGCAIPIDGGG